MSEFPDEYILCSAIWYKQQRTAQILPKNIKQGVVVCGHRHPHAIHTFVALTGKRSVTTECGDYEQGFLTSKNRFVSREEASKIAFDCGQISEEKVTLFSEDIY